MDDPEIIYKVRHYWDRISDYNDVLSVEFVKHQSTDT